MRGKQAMAGFPPSTATGQRRSPRSRRRAMAEPAEAAGGGIIGTELAASLLMITPPVLLEISKKGWFRPVAPDQWRVVTLVQGYVRYLQDRLQFGTVQEMADEFGISTQHLLDLIRDGHLPPGERLANRRQIKLDRYATRKAYSKYEAERRRDMTQEGTENRVRDARAKDIEMKTALRSRELIPMSDAVFALDTVVGLTRSTLGGAAARISRDLAVQTKADDVIDHCLNTISEGLRKAVHALRAGSDPLLPTTPLHS